MKNKNNTNEFENTFSVTTKGIKCNKDLNAWSIVERYNTSETPGYDTLYFSLNSKSPSVATFPQTISYSNTGSFYFEYAVLGFEDLEGNLLKEYDLPLATSSPSEGGTLNIEVPRLTGYAYISVKVKPTAPGYELYVRAEIYPDGDPSTFEDTIAYTIANSEIENKYYLHLQSSDSTKDKIYFPNVFFTDTENKKMSLCFEYLK